MNTRTSSTTIFRMLLGFAVLAGLAAVIWVLLPECLGIGTRGEALGTALLPLIDGKDSERATVARIIWESYRETRSNAALWSGVYWGCTFVAALLSAAAALVLKLETLVKTEGLKKDLAAAFSIAAALLVTVSTSGDFQRKWQANRIAAATLERTGYTFLENNGADSRAYLAAVGDTLLRRQLAIVGNIEKPEASADAGAAPSAKDAP